MACWAASDLAQYCFAFEVISAIFENRRVSCVCDKMIELFGIAVINRLGRATANDGL